MYAVEIKISHHLSTVCATQDISDGMQHGTRLSSWLSDFHLSFHMCMYAKPCRKEMLDDTVAQ